jgi:hypothetical protein
MVFSKSGEFGVSEGEEEKLIPSFTRKTLENGSKDKLFPHRRGRMYHSPRPSFIPQPFSNQRKLMGSGLIQQNGPAQVTKKCLES